MDTRENQVEEEERRDVPAEQPSGGPETSDAGEQSEKEEVQETSAPQEATSQEALEVPVKPLTTGQIVDGLIVHMDEQGAMVDVGTKSEGRISVGELAGGMTDDGKPLEVGDRVSVYVVRAEDEDGNPVLSKKRADYERVWRRVTQAYERGDVLSAMVSDRVKGGLVVDLGLRGFLPASHVRTRNVHALDRFVGQSLKVKVIEIDRARKRVVVSHKKAIEEDRQRRRQKTLESLDENKVYRGIVRRVTDYGAFVDLGGVDGLLHITEMSWTRINHPSDVVKVGQKMDVMVLRFDRERNRISLGLKQILPDPWEDIHDIVKVGETVAGKVTRLVPFGAFVRLESGIEGIVPNAELPGERGQRAADVLSTGQDVQVKVVNMRPAERRMTLSMRQVQQAKERAQIKEFMRQQEEDSRVTIGDLFGTMLSEAAEDAEEAAPRQEAEAESAEVKRGENGAEAQAAAETPEPAGAEEETAEKQAAAGAGEETSEGVQETVDQDQAGAEVVLESEAEAPTEKAGEERSEPAEDEGCSSSESPGESEAAKD